MKAWVQDRFGEPEDVMRFEDVPEPAPAADEVLVRVRAASVNALDWHLVTGEPRVARVGGIGLRRPAQRVAGADVAGVVAAVGADVDGLAVGERVFGVARGSFAEAAISRPAALARIPDGVSDVEAAALPVAAVTALQGLRDHAGLRAGQRLLVTGASSGVGTHAVQLAVHLGADVTATCGPANLELVRGLGAQRVVDRTVDASPTVAGGYHAILHVAGTQRPSHLRRMLAPAGVLVNVGGDGGPWLGPVGRIVTGLFAFLGRTQRQVVFTADESRPGDKEHLADLVAQGVLVPQVTRTVALADVGAAVADARAGRLPGKTVVVVDGPQA